MTPRAAIAAVYWDRVALKAGVTGVYAYATEKRVVVRHGERSRPFDPERDEWVSAVIAWLAGGGK